MQPDQLIRRILDRKWLLWAEGAYDVFISYPHQERTVANAVCAKLEDNRIRCWIAPRDVTPGNDWGAAIINAIAGVKIMVVVFSEHANISEQVKREVERAVNKGIPIIPLRIEDVRMSKSLEYPFVHRFLRWRIS